MSHLLMGDVHGCLAELQALWQQLPLDEVSTLVFLGDLIDKGPDSNGVLDFVLAQQALKPLVLIRGNHEAKALRWLQRGRESELSFTPTPERVGLLQSALPYYGFDDGKHLALHGGIYPAFWRHEPVLPDPSTEAQWPKRLQQQVERFAFCRYVNPKGHTIPFGEEGPTDPLWASLYDGRAGLAFFGHEPHLEVKRYPHAYGLDTSCVYGVQLTAVQVFANGELKWFQQAAFGQYAEPLLPLC